MSKLTFHGGVGSVTGANFLLEGGGKKILVDCGIYQGGDEASKRNAEDFPYEPSQIDFILVTHAHMDHIGRIPKLVSDGFKGQIISTKETRDTAPIMYDDAISIMRHEKEKYKDEKRLLYQENDVEKTMSLWRTLDYHENKNLFDNVSFQFYDAGHILGSAYIKINWGGKKIVFSGDLGNTPSALVRETESVEDADYMVIESVYGDRVHEEVKERKTKLKRVVTETIKKGGALLIPSFSLERTQILLHELNDMVEGGEIPEIPVFLDSPLAIKLTDIYRQADSKLFNKHARGEILKGDKIFNFPGLRFTDTVEESKEIMKTKNPKIVIAGSGMSSGGRIIHHEKHFLGDPDSTILFVGYQSPGSLGRHIQEGVKEVKIFNKKIKVRVNVETIRGFSAHADRDKLLWFVEGSRDSLKKVYVAMGELKSSLFLAQRINDFLGVEAKVPEVGEAVVLE